MFRYLLASAALLTATFASAQERPLIDVEVGYAARETNDATDNDLTTATLGLNWGGGTQGTRLAFTLGARIEEGDEDTGLVLGAEVLRYQDLNQGTRIGYGARLVYDETFTTSGELALGVQQFYNRFSVRALAGLEGVSDDVPFRDDGTVFGVVEGTWYASDRLAVRAGIQADGSGELFGLGLEWQIGRSDFSIVAEGVVGINEYRGTDSYDNLTVSLRYVPGLGSPQARDRQTGAQLLRRLVAVQ